MNLISFKFCATSYSLNGLCVTRENNCFIVFGFFLVMFILIAIDCYNKIKNIDFNCNCKEKSTQNLTRTIANNKISTNLHVFMFTTDSSVHIASINILFKIYLFESHKMRKYQLKIAMPIIAVCVCYQSLNTSNKKNLKINLFHIASDAKIRSFQPH